MAKFYPHYKDEENIGSSFDYYAKRKKVEVESETRDLIVELLVRRIKEGPKYEFTDEDIKIFEDVKKNFKDPELDFEKEFLMFILKRNYVLSRYKDGEIDFDKAWENIDMLFDNTNDMEKQLEDMFHKDDWKFWVDKEGCKVYKRKWPGNSMLMIKSTKSFKTKWKFQDVARFCYDFPVTSIEPEHRLFYEKNDIDNCYFNTLLFLDENNDIVHLRQTPHSFVVSDRDFVFCRRYLERKKTAYSFGVSCDYDENRRKWFPRDKKAVRGMVDVFCWRATQVDDETVELTYFLHADPRGWVPALIYNFVVKNKGVSVARYIRTIEGIEKETDEVKYQTRERRLGKKKKDDESDDESEGEESSEEEEEEKKKKDDESSEEEEEKEKEESSSEEEEEEEEKKKEEEEESDESED